MSETVDLYKSETVDLYNLFRPLDASRPAPADPAPRLVDVDLRVRLPAATPFADVASALKVMEEVFGGVWVYIHAPGSARGRFEMEVRP